MEDSNVLFPTVRRGDVSYCLDVAPIQRLMVRVDALGNVLIKGQRDEIEALLPLLRRHGLIGSLKYISFCG